MQDLWVFGVVLGMSCLHHRVVSLEELAKTVTISAQPRHSGYPEQECGGVFRDSQVVLTSPHYPGDFPEEVRCEYVMRSPYVCSTQFHVQFLDFRLKASRNCVKNSLRIGEDSLCGQVIGIKTYNSSDGVLKLVFCAKGSKGESTSGEGFKILVTRLPCRETHKEIEQRPPSPEISPSQTEIEVKAKQYSPPFGYLPSIPGIIPPSQNVPTNGYQPQSPPPPTNGFPPQDFPYSQKPLICFPLPQFPEFPPTYHQPGSVLPAFPPSNSFGGLGFNISATPSDHLPKTEAQVQPWPWPPASGGVQQCCVNTFRQKRFYLTSPGFPRSSNYPRDCFYVVEKFGPSVCRLRIEFKFFSVGVPAVPPNSQLCADDFIEIDNHRICGCRTGLVYRSQWGLGAKIIRVRSSGRFFNAPQSNGFVLDVYQEDCPFRYSSNSEDSRRSETKDVIQFPTSAPSVQFSANKRYDRTTEGPNSQFISPGWSNRDPCSFSLADYLRLAVESLWIDKPICIAPQSVNWAYPQPLPGRL